MQNEKICNRCGSTLDVFDLQQNFKIRRHIQYGSVYDGRTVNYNLCCDCFDHLIVECVVSPLGSSAQCS